MAWSIERVPDLSGKVIVITGATSGIGLSAAKQLSAKNATIVMACRNAQKMASVASTFGPGPVHQLLLDVSDLDSVRACVTAFRSTGLNQIDVLLLNAGICGQTPTLSKQGIDLTFATNHLGHWLLTGLLLDILVSTPSSRIISVTSIGHRIATTIDYERAFGRKQGPLSGAYLFQWYCQTKTANHWFVSELNRRLENAGKHTIVVPAHPGCTQTNIVKRDNQPKFFRVMDSLTSFFLTSSDQGSLPLVMAATDPKIHTSCNYSPDSLFETRGYPQSNAYKAAHVADETRARELWSISEEMTGFEYPI